MALWDTNLDDELNLQFDPNAYARELVDGAVDLSDDEKALLAKALTKDSVARKLRSSVVSRSEAQRKMDKARAIAEEGLRVRDANMRWVDDNKTEFERWLQEQQGGQRGGQQQQQHTQQPTVRGIDEQTFRRELAERDAAWQRKLDEIDQSYTGVLAGSMKLMNAWNKEFPGEPYPYDELQTFALERKLSLDHAFPLFVGPKRDEKRKGEIEAIRKAAFEEGRQAAAAEREELATVDQGGDLGSAFKDVLLGRRSQKVSGADGKELQGEDAFVQRWNATRGFTQQEKQH